MSTKLRDLIRNVRSCKTAAEERAIIQKEKAAIRESFLANENEYRPRNVAKLLFIQMMGHDTEFGQMDCLKLITASSFTEKRIGYLGLTQLFSEKSEVLMMATNRIRIDLNNSSNYIVALALMALSEICTTEMCRELASEVLKLLTSGTSYIKKKAALACTRVITKVPEKIEDFAEKCELLMEDRHHGVLVGTLQLCQHIISVAPTQKNRFSRFVGPMVRILKSLLTSYSAEYDIAGISDPFLQVEILRFFRTMCTGNQSLSDEVSDILAQITANTSANKNAGNAVLYEAVRTIMSIESANTLKTLGINLLGKFLGNKDANSKYVSLFMLQKVLKHDISSVQKYRLTILECLKENDTSIKALALDLVYLICNESNVKSVVKELLNHLLNLPEEDEFTQELTNKTCAIVDKYAPSRRWYVDTLIKVLVLAGNYVNEESTSSFIHLVTGTPELQSYAVHKLYFSLTENVKQEGLARATLYCLGDFGQILVQGTTSIDNHNIQVTEDEVIGLVETVLQYNKVTDTVKEYALTALIKLYAKFQLGHSRIAKLIRQLTTSTSIEVQKRAVEYSRLLEEEWESERLGICEQIPPSKVCLPFYESKPIGETDIDEYPPEATKSKSITPTVISNISGNISGGSGNLLDFDTVGETVPTILSQPIAQGIYKFEREKGEQEGEKQNQQPINQNIQPQNPKQEQFNLLNLYSSNQFPSPQLQMNNAFSQQLGQSPQLLQQNSQNALQQLNQQQQYQQQQQQQQQQLQQQDNSFNLKAFDDGSLEILFSATKDFNADGTTIVATFNNKTQSPISGIIFQVAVLKYLKLLMNPMNNNQLNPNSTNQVTQTMKITNSLQGQKAIVMKIKIGYVIDGRQINSECTVNQFATTY